MGASWQSGSLGLSSGHAPGSFCERVRVSSAGVQLWEAVGLLAGALRRQASADAAGSVGVCVCVSVCAQEGRTACGRVPCAQRGRVVLLPAQTRHQPCSVSLHPPSLAGLEGLWMRDWVRSLSVATRGWKYRALPWCFWASLLMGDGCDSGGRGWRTEARLVPRGIQEESGRPLPTPRPSSACHRGRAVPANCFRSSRFPCSYSPPPVTVSDPARVSHLSYLQSCHH